MPSFICTTCGTQHAESEQSPPACTVCQDERQYVKKTGQQWTTLEKLRLTNRNSIKFKEPGLIGIGIEPHFAIGQRALFLRSPSGNILWDCLPLIDQAVVECFQALGGISAIAISHPHYYSSMVEWSRAFGGVPIYLHAADRQWVMRPDKAIVSWEGETWKLAEGLTLIRCGGHFEGGTVLHWAGGAEGRGALLTGDVIQVVPDRKHVSFMYSYPNYIPLSASAIEKIAKAVEPFEYDRVYGAFWEMVIEQDGKAVVKRSAEGYLRAIAKAGS
jgi:glyoxylase-like metal-dependent hydrolase (beta-lactamase superfamily II)